MAYRYSAHVGQNRMALSMAPAAHHARVRVKNGSGTWVNLADLRGQDFVRSVDVTEDADQPVASAVVVLARAIGDLSLVPGKTSILNQDDTGADSMLLDGFREIEIAAQYQPPGEPADHSVGAPWWVFFRGYIDNVEWSSVETEITVSARDLGAPLLDAVIKFEGVYSNTTGVALQTVLQDILKDAITDNGGTEWKSGTAYGLGDLVWPTALDGYYYECTDAGTSGATEPVWTILASPVTDGGVEWTRRSYLPAIYTPASPGWNIKQFTQSKGPILLALRALVDQIGWDLRFDWRNGDFTTYATENWQLTLQAPDRATGMISGYAQPFLYGYREIGARRGQRTIATVRNEIAVPWTSNGATGSRSTEPASDATSIAAYGRRYMEMAEASTSNIDTVTEAAAMAAAALADLKTPRNTYTIDWPLFLPARLWDAWTVPADDITTDVDTAMGITGFQHHIDASGGWTSVTLVAGAVVGARRSYLGREVRPGIAAAAPAMSDNNRWQARVYLGSDQSGVAAGAWTQVLLDCENYDIGDKFAEATTHRYTVPRSGTWDIQCAAVLKAATAGHSVGVRIWHVPAGGAGVVMDAAYNSAEDASDVRVTLRTQKWLSVGDTIEMQVWHEDTAALAVTGGGPTFMAIHRQR